MYKYNNKIEHTLTLFQINFKKDSGIVLGTFGSFIIFTLFVLK